MQENYLSPFLKQALVAPKITNKDFKLSDPTKAEVKKLNSDYTLNVGGSKVFHKYSNSGGDDLVDFLNKQFDAKPTFKNYNNYYKVFFLGEKGGRMNGTEYVALGGHTNGITFKAMCYVRRPNDVFRST